jgi:hypothetical protein
MFSKFCVLSTLVLIFTNYAWASATSMPVFAADSSISERQLQSEESYFAISALLDSNLSATELMYYLAPYARALNPDHRSKLYRKYKMFTVPTTFGIGPIVSILQGDGLGIGLFGGGVALIAGTLVLTSSGSGTPFVANLMLYSGFGCIIASAVRAGNVNDERKEYNNVLRAALRLSDDVSYQLTPFVRQFPDGTIAPTLVLQVRL